MILNPHLVQDKTRGRLIPCFSPYNLPSRILFYAAWVKLGSLCWSLMRLRRWSGHSCDTIFIVSVLEPCGLHVLLSPNKTQNAELLQKLCELRRI